MNIQKDLVTPATIAIQNYFPYLASVLTPFLSAHPVWEAVFFSAIGLYGVYMAYNQEEVNEIVRFINEHPDEFREEIVKSKQFQKGFLVFTENYLKQRIEKKKEILQKVILGFTNTEDKDTYELERLNDCLARMSIESLEFLVFLKKEIIPSIEEAINTELQQETYQKSDRSVEWWHERLWEGRSIWEPVDKWIYDNFSSNSHKVKKQYDMLNAGWPSDTLHRVETLERAKRSEFTECINELVTLGIFRIKITGGVIGSGAGSDYSMTGFGKKFMTLIEGTITS